MVNLKITKPSNPEPPVRTVFGQHPEQHPRADERQALGQAQAVADHGMDDAGEEDGDPQRGDDPGGRLGQVLQEATAEEAGLAGLGAVHPVPVLGVHLAHLEQHGLAHLVVDRVGGAGAKSEGPHEGGRGRCKE